MSKKTIYLAGSMTGLSYEEQNGWRADLKKQLETLSQGKFECINPVEHFTIGASDDREAMVWDLLNVRHSDLLIVDMNHPNSIGTTWELGVATELRIPYIGFCDVNKLNDLHPWWKLNCMRIFNDMEDLVLYVLDKF